MCACEFGASLVASSNDFASGKKAFVASGKESGGGDGGVTGAGGNGSAPSVGREI